VEEVQEEVQAHKEVEEELQAILFMDQFHFQLVLTTAHIKLVVLGEVAIMSVQDHILTVQMVMVAMAVIVILSVIVLPIQQECGGQGGPSQNNNGATGFACSGGAGSSIGTGTHTASSGSVHTGGSSPTSTWCTGAGGGSSPYENGSNGSAGNANAGHAGAGGIGGRATRSIDMSAPWTGFSATEYFCEGGSGACARTAIGSDTITPINSYYGHGGKGSGVPDNSPTNRCTSALSTSFGCGGGGSFQAMGIGSGVYAGAGSAGLFLLAF
jgi:hypothetical protein